MPKSQPPPTASSSSIPSSSSSSPPIINGNIGGGISVPVSLSSSSSSPPPTLLLLSSSSFSFSTPTAATTTAAAATTTTTTTTTAAVASTTVVASGKNSGDGDFGKPGNVPPADDASKNHLPPTSSPAPESRSSSSQHAHRKRNRATAEQVALLEKVFSINRSPNAQIREQLAKMLNMQPRQVQVWFQNRRAKEKMIQRRTLTAGHVPPPPQSEGPESVVLTPNALHALGPLFADQFPLAGLDLQRLGLSQLMGDGLAENVHHYSHAHHHHHHHHQQQQQQQQGSPQQPEFSWLQAPATANPLLQPQGPTDVNSVHGLVTQGMSINTSATALSQVGQGPRSAPPNQLSHFGTTVSMAALNNHPPGMGNVNITGAEWTNAALHSSTAAMTTTNAGLNIAGPGHLPSSSSAKTSVSTSLSGTEATLTPPQSSLSNSQLNSTTSQPLHNHPPAVVGGDGGSCLLRPQDSDAMHMEVDSVVFAGSHPSQHSRTLPNSILGDDRKHLPVFLPIKLLNIGNWRRISTNDTVPDLVCYGTIPISPISRTTAAMAESQDDGHFGWVVRSNDVRYKLKVPYSAINMIGIQALSHKSADGQLELTSDAQGGQPCMPGLHDASAVAHMRVQLMFPPRYFIESKDGVNHGSNGGDQTTQTATKWVEMRDFTASEEASHNSEHNLIAPFWVLTQQMHILSKANECLRKVLDPVAMSILGISTGMSLQVPSAGKPQQAQPQHPQQQPSLMANSLWMPNNLHPRTRVAGQPFPGGQLALTTPPPSAATAAMPIDMANPRSATLLNAKFSPMLQSGPASGSVGPMPVPHTGKDSLADQQQQQISLMSMHEDLSSGQSSPQSKESQLQADILAVKGSRGSVHLMGPVASPSLPLRHPSASYSRRTAPYPSGGPLGSQQGGVFHGNATRSRTSSARRGSRDISKLNSLASSSGLGLPGSGSTSREMSPHLASSRVPHTSAATAPSSFSRVHDYPGVSGRDVGDVINHQIGDMPKTATLSQTLASGVPGAYDRGLNNLPTAEMQAAQCASMMMGAQHPDHSSPTPEKLVSMIMANGNTTPDGVAQLIQQIQLQAATTNAIPGLATTSSNSNSNGVGESEGLKPPSSAASWGDDIDLARQLGLDLVSPTYSTVNLSNDDRGNVMSAMTTAFTFPVSGSGAHNPPSLATARYPLQQGPIEIAGGSAAASSGALAANNNNVMGSGGGVGGNNSSGIIPL
ncbi:hypothetical protein EV182_000091 [Spiromyces aspiralis]|uniref:Uncharacterized protein n=1 Tax=Spiromyces aspiralis TaxID=68401 RepID=A0ACC1HII0_9FUNG|nr:hypothetical protein EV182_000091 [Spiromyces aspiralis]